MFKIGSLLSKIYIPHIRHNTVAFHALVRMNHKSGEISQECKNQHVQNELKILLCDTYGKTRISLIKTNKYCEN